MKQRDGTAIAKASLVALLVGCATSNAGTIPVVPETLKVPNTQVLSLETQATGVQIYECNASKDDPTRFKWVFKAPEAELFDSAGKKIGRHYAGPTWDSTDGSRVVGEVKARDNGPDPNAIPWLLLSAKSTPGNGVLSQTQSIQRVHTVGGKAPAKGCNQAKVGKETRVAYKAAYYFFVARP
jgi:Protein of unknown function (DUF3455)